jgi:uncharacterized membrane protein SpoIIM required for sporulation
VVSVSSICYILMKKEGGVKLNIQKASRVSIVFVLVMSLFASTIGAVVTPSKTLAYAGDGSSYSPYVITNLMAMVLFSR